LRKKITKIFHSECGSGFRSHLNLYPDPKHWWKIFLKNNFFAKSFGKMETLKSHPGNNIFPRKLSQKQKFSGK
jgi:hypothetical protein